MTRSSRSDTFEFTQKEAAEARAAELTAKGKGTHFVQRTKEAMPEDAPGLGASIPRVVTPAPKASRKAAAAAVAAPVEEEEEIEEEEDVGTSRSRTSPTTTNENSD